MLKWLVVLALTGCVTSSNPHVFRPVGFTPEQVIALEDAADAWTKAGYPTVIDPTCADEGCSTVRPAHQDPQWDGICEAFNYVLGVPRRVGCTQDNDPIRYEIRLVTDGAKGDPNIVRKTFLHEIGHTFGFKHVHGPGKTMSDCGALECEPEELTL
jgi:hypothetical protein